MQKKIIVLAIAAAISSPAFADTSNVSVYGGVDLAFGSTSNGVVNATQVSSQVTKLGLKGSEDLGEGLNAIWQIEQQIDIDNSAGNATQGTHNTLASRNSYLGLKGESWGTALLGIHDTPYKIAIRKLDVFDSSLADNRSLLGGGTAATNGAAAHDARPANVLAYISPKLSGFTAAAAYVAGAELTTTAAQQKGSAYSLAGIYDVAPFYGSLAYQSFKYGTAGTGTFGAAGTLAAGDTLSATRLGFGYTLDALQLNVAYEKNKSSILGLDKFGRSNWYLAGKYNLGNDAVKLAYTKAGIIGGVANTGAKQISVGYDHSLSKRTTLYALYTKLSNDAGANYGLSTAGSTAGGAAVALGNNPYGYGVGIRHTF